MSATTYGPDLEITREKRDQDADAAASTSQLGQATPQDRPAPASAAVTSTGSTPPQSQSLARPTFTITEAATACSMSRKTITRKLPELASNGAAKDEDGVWRIPVEALLAVGLHPGRSLPPLPVASPRPAAPPVAPARETEVETITIRRDRWDDVRIRLARAEAEASERGLALADARLALRALTAGPATAIRTEAASESRDNQQQSDRPMASPATFDEGVASPTAPGAAAPPPVSGWEPMATSGGTAIMDTSTSGFAAAPSGAGTDGTRTKRRRWWHSS